ncbi:MAG: response regulator [Pseudobacteriovorax sp.]|nr:response regulator [Pseudobacteriovorax sp.]
MKKRNKNIYLSLALAGLASFFTLLIFLISVNILGTIEISKSLVRQYQEDLIKGSNEKVIVQLRNHVQEDSKIEAIVVHWPLNGSKINVDDHYNQRLPTLEKWLWIRFIKYKQPIYLFEGENEIHSEMLFYIDLFAQFDLILIPWVLFIFIYLFIYFRRESKYKFEQLKEIEFSRSQAIAHTTQMLAHDVRKPFSMIKALVSMIDETPSEKESKAILTENIPSISGAIASVEGMLQDVLSIGSDTAMEKEDIYARGFVRDILIELFRFKDDLDINLRYEIDSSLIWHINHIKYARVFSNIIGNAIEHMKGKGDIWIKVTMPHEGFSTVTLGNSNTYISPTDLARLFESFFTKGKKGGTGLGLAIAKMVVEAHYGKIWCESSKDEGTRFKFTIPARIGQKPGEETELPHYSKDFLIKPSFIPEKTNDDAVDPILLEQIKKGDCNIAIVDDEKIYSDYIRSSLSSLDTPINLQEFSRGETLLANGCASFDLVILDVDLRLGNQNGFEICRQLREFGYEGKLCIHSNRGRLEFQPKAIEAGADFFLPKPMGKNDLVMLLSQCVDLEKAETSSVKALLFEDEGIYQRQWKRLYGPGELEIHDSLNSFDISSAQGYDYAICDYYLKNGETGIEVARKLREAGFDKPIFLNSNVDSLPDDEAELFDLIVKKDAKEAFEQITEFLGQA